jgi:hypothetical protein
MKLHPRPIGYRGGKNAWVNELSLKVTVLFASSPDEDTRSPVGGSLSVVIQAD